MKTKPGKYHRSLKRLCLACIWLFVCIVSPLHADSKTQGYYQQGIDNLTRGDLLKAEMFFVRAYRSDRLSHTGYEELLAIYDMQGRFDKGLELVDKELAHRGESAKLVLQKGLALVNLKRVNDAQPYYLRAGDLAPNDVRVLYAIEQYLTNAGKTAQAQTYAAQRELIEAQQ